MPYYVVRGTKQQLKALHKNYPADYFNELFIIYKDLPPEINRYPVKVASITDEEYAQIKLAELTELLKENSPIKCKSEKFKGMVGILRKIFPKTNGKAPTCIVELSTGGGMILAELNIDEIEAL